MPNFAETYTTETMRTIKHIILSGLILLSTVSTQAQKMQDILKTMPDSIIPLLTHNDRLDFLDYAAANTHAELTNRLGGKSQLTIIDESYARFQLTTLADIQLKQLPTGGGYIICVVNTRTFESMADSNITFYNKDWQKLPLSDFLQLPTEGFTQLLLQPFSTDLFVLRPDAPEKSQELQWNGQRFQLKDAEN